MKIVYAFFIGFCGSGSYAIINMLFSHMLTQRLALLALLPCFLLDLSLVCLIMTRKREKKKRKKGGKQKEKKPIGLCVSIWRKN